MSSIVLNQNEDKAKVFYVHGFRSSGNSSTARKLQEALGAGFDVIAPSYPSEDPEAAYKVLQEALHDICSEEVIIVGSSLGGFHAQLLSADFCIPAVLVNPSVFPYENMKKYGIENEFYKTLEDVRDSLEEIRPSDCPLIVIVGDNDNVVPPNMNGRKIENAHHITIPGMNHRPERDIEFRAIANSVKALSDHMMCIGYVN